MTWQIIEGDCRESLRTLPERSAQTCVTSPPYFGLRDYGHDGQIGLEPTPDEFVAAMVAVFREVRRVLRDDGTVWLNLGDSYCAATSTARSSERERARSGWDGPFKVPSLDRREVSSSQGTDRRVLPGLKQKDLIGIPWMVAFALRADGWVLRSEIVWSKPNPMPESVTDRPTKAHEQLFLLSKAKRVGPEPTKYDDIPDGEARWLAALVDAEGSIVCRREAPGADGSYGAHAAQVSIGGTCRALLDRIAAVVGEGSVLERPGTNAPMFYWQTSGKRAAGLLRRLYPFLVVKQRQARCVIHLESGKAYRGGRAITPAEVAGRERLWEAVKSLNHFGDPDLSWVPEPMFGRWVPQPYFYDADAVREAQAEGTEARTAAGFKDRYADVADAKGYRGPLGGQDGATFNPAGRNKRSVWTVATQPFPGAHFATFPPKLIEPCILAGSAPGDVVLDPFSGSGTTGMVALRHDRSYVGCELNPEYVELSRQRICNDAPLLNTWAEAA